MICILTFSHRFESSEDSISPDEPGSVWKYAPTPGSLTQWTRLGNCPAIGGIAGPVHVSADPSLNGTVSKVPGHVIYACGPDGLALFNISGNDAVIMVGWFKALTIIRTIDQDWKPAPESSKVPWTGRKITVPMAAIGTKVYVLEETELHVLDTGK